MDEDGGVSDVPADVERTVRDDSRRATLRALETLGDTDDADFDHLTRLAAALMQAPVAVVSLVDLEREWVKSCVGAMPRETPIRDSFGAHAIAVHNPVMVVEDTRQDSRFANNPLVTGEPYLRFYAAAPIVVSGARIGVLCVFDQKPRSRPDDTQLQQLVSLAALASSFFALKDDKRRGSLTRAALVREEKRRALALEAGMIASWVWDVRTDLVECDALLLVLFNLQSVTQLKANDILLAIDPRDLTDKERHLREVLRHTDDYSGEYRVAGVSPPRWLAGRGKVVERDANGDPLLVFGVHFDITERRSAEERQRLLLREINHRVKNTLATVQALATQTVRYARDPREFLDAFSSRLQAFGIAHGLLSDREWRGIGLKELIRLQVMPFDGSTPPRVLVSGEDILLSADQALALGLILHELASNALRYGALSVATGNVDLAWEINETETGRSHLEISWRERGGPAVEPPQHQGFGSILIQRSLSKVLSSSVKHEFPPEGVTAHISMPLESEPT
jgi:two-component sensor histidine kinase